MEEMSVDSVVEVGRMDRREQGGPRGAQGGFRV